jgi:hypothetical protein
MTEESNAQEVDAFLRGIRRRKFVRIPRFHGRDAWVAFVPDHGDIAQAVQEKFNEQEDQRWYPTEGGHLVKWPHMGEELDPSHFRLEPGGWDHEHCHACNAPIRRGDAFWLTTRTLFIALCEACHARMLRKGS